ncbi:MAG: hypothetical protein JXA14_26110 [Anaerolineae bacterium]|nr:hypothetical protein [Anaerolineae bacterium]
MGSLVGGKPAPVEYIQLIACRDLYHCRPCDLAGVPLVTILQHLNCVKMERKYERIEAAKARRRSRGKRK